MLDEICTAWGRAAEDIFFGKIYWSITRFRKSNKDYYAMVSLYGLSKNIGNISYYDSSGQQSAFTKPYSEERAQNIDKEVSAILDKQYKRAKQILTKYKEKAKTLSYLLTKEVIFKSDLEDFGPRK